MGRTALVASGDIYESCNGGWKPQRASTGEDSQLARYSEHPMLMRTSVRAVIFEERSESPRGKSYHHSLPSLPASCVLEAAVDIHVHVLVVSDDLRMAVSHIANCASHAPDLLAQATSAHAALLHDSTLVAPPAPLLVCMRTGDRVCCCKL